MFTCNKCKGEFEESMRASGYAQCRPCRAEYLKQWRVNNPGRNAALCAKWTAENRDYKLKLLAEYRAKPENAEKARLKAKQWYSENKERALAWEAANREKRQEQSKLRHQRRYETDAQYREYCRQHGRVTRAKRRAAEAANLAKSYATEIKRIYARCPEGHEVDHIVPLLGKNVSGLHVPWNLQYLPVKANRSKGNKLKEAA